MLATPASALHWASFALAAAAVACGLRRRHGDRAGVGVAAVTGVVMLAAMADTAAGAMLLGPWTPLAWTGVLLAAGIAAAWAGRRATHAPDGPHDDAAANAEAPLHLLHVTCLPVMAALTAAMAQHATAPAGHHGHGGALTAVALVSAAVHVAAGCGVTLGRRRRRLDRTEALAGAGAVAAMAGAAVL
ncbi:hypothetical protein [Isoptericola sp. NPDC057391]|uniref:hypothetical protein n=1 Tax=Isoptericola sp. NPDC057391 TaxID=3346117 RepID=UPI003626B1BA